MKSILFIVLMLTSKLVFPLDFSDITLKDFDVKPKTELLILGENLTKKLRTELDVGLTIAPTQTDLQSTAGISFTYTVLASPDKLWSVNAKTGIHYQAYVLNGGDNYYGTAGIEIVKHIGTKKFYVLEITHKIDQAPTDSPTYRMTAGWRILTGIRYQF